MSEDRLDRVERIVSSLADAIQANTQGIAELRAANLEIRDQRERDEQDWRDDRATMQRAVTSLVEIAQTTFARVDATIARVDQMQGEVITLQGQVTTLQGQTQDTINQVRDLQVQGNRIMERLDRGQGA